MKKNNQIILLNSADNTSSIKAVLNFYKENDKILLLANSNSSFLKDSLEKLQKSMLDFKKIYNHVECMFLKEKIGILDKQHGKSSFIAEIENLISDKEFSTIYFHRFDTTIECTSLHECEFLISKILTKAAWSNKKVIFSINNKTETGQLIHTILSKVATQKYEIKGDKRSTPNQLILLKSSDETKLIKSALNHYQNGEETLFLADRVTLDLKYSFKTLEKNMPNFDDIYAHLSCMFLKDKWENLDKIYGKVFFLYEMQEMMKNEKLSTIYFHKLDTMLDGATSQDCQLIISDIKEFARYYHKKILFSIDSKTEFGKILEDILLDIVDYEQKVEILNTLPANLVLPIKENKKRVRI